MGTAWIPLEGHTENTPSCVFVLITCGAVVGASPPKSSLGMKVAMMTLIHIHAQHLATYMTLDSQSTANHPITPLVVHSLGRSEALSQRKRLSCLIHPCLRIQGLYSVICRPLKTQRAQGLWEQRQEVSHCHSRSERGSWTLAP